MTTICTTPARLSLRRAVIAIAMAFGVTVTALPAGTAEAAPVTYVVHGATVTAASQAAKDVVYSALAQRRDPYVWGGAGPDAFDCSGLTQYAYAAAGVTLPHSSRMQSTMGTYVPKSQLRPGDLVFFYSPVSHVGIYVGNGMMVHAPNSGSTVRLVELNYMYDYATARRIL